MNYCISFVLLLSVVTACTKDLGRDLPFNGPDLVLYGVLSPDSVVTLQVRQTYPPTGRYVYEKGVQTALVYLYEDSVRIEQLRHQQEGQYGSARNTKPQVGKSYYYVVSSPGYPDAYSLPERIPGPVKISDVVFDEAISAPLNSGVPARKLVCTFTDPATPNDYYSIDIAGYSDEKEVAVNSVGLDRPDEFEDGCGFRSNGQSNGYNLSDICFNGQTTTVRVGVELEGPTRPTGIRGKVTKILLRLHRTNRGYFEYNRTFNIGEGLLQAFQAPQVRYSNVRGGYGIILAYNSDTVTIIP